MNRKADFLLNKSIRITNRIDSNRELECSSNQLMPLRQRGATNSSTNTVRRAVYKLYNSQRPLTVGERTSLQTALWMYATADVLLQHFHSLAAFNSTVKRADLSAFLLSNCTWCVLFISAFSALTLLVGRQEGHPACKNWWGAGVVQTGIWPSWCHCHSLSLASVKSRLVLPFWYWLTWVVPEKGR